MTQQYYVTASESGVEYTADGEVSWALPAEGGTPVVTRHDGLRLRDPDALLEVLDEAIFVAEATEDGEEEDGELVVGSAQLLRRTPWAPASAAGFALDCAEHVLGDAGEVTLPTGTTLAGALADARAYLASADEETGERLGRLARYSAARRLRRTGASIGDVALAMLEDDLAHALDVSTDPDWALTTAAGDAVLAAVEALRHLAAPRYVTLREETAEREGTPQELLTPTPITTPWGPVMFGAEHESPYLPAGVLAREAAFRARQSVGPEQATAEREFQVARLCEVIEER